MCNVYYVQCVLCASVLSASANAIASVRVSVSKYVNMQKCKNVKI